MTLLLQDEDDADIPVPAARAVAKKRTASGVRKTSTKKPKEGEDFDSLTVPALQQLCKAQGIKTSGNKTELVARLSGKSLLPKPKVAKKIKPVDGVPIGLLEVMDVETLRKRFKE